MDTCRDRFGTFQPTAFNVYACAMCYQYLFESNDSKDPFLGKLDIRRIQSQNSSLINSVLMDFMNSSLVVNVCSQLKEADCSRWTDCCAAAKRCCNEQLTSPVLYMDQPYCPRTWDGFSCVNDTLAGTTAHLPCPSYITGPTDSAEMAYKFCTENGSWFTEGVKYQEWTDYTPCVQLENYRLLFYAAVSCHAISLAMTVPACLIFLVFRQLRQQHRVQIHLNMFLSCLLTNVVWILWENLVYSDRLEKKADNSLMHRDTAGCKILYVLTRYTISANFFWMFLEGVYLLRLVVNAFVLPRSLTWYYVFGWAGPLFFLLIYTGIKISHGHGGCWVYMMKGYEWWIYTPNLVMLLANVGSLAWIIYTLTTQIHVHPNEPSSYRRALRAMVLLTPLFGLQMILVVYRPSIHNFALEITAAIFKSSQGAVVAIMFCYTNGGVRAQIQAYIQHVKERLTFEGTFSSSSRDRREADLNLKIRFHKVSIIHSRVVDQSHL